MKFAEHFEAMDAPTKIESCIKSQCSKFEKRSTELRTVKLDDADDRLIWSIREAKEDFKLEECHR